MRLGSILVLAAFLTACGRNQLSKDTTTSGAAASANQAGTPPNSTGAAAAAPEVYKIPAGTTFRVRMDETLDTRDRFTATLNTPVTVEGRTAIPQGTRFAGHLAHIGLTLDSFTLNGNTYPVDTQAAASNKKNVSVPAETVLNFRLREPINVTENAKASTR